MKLALLIIDVQKEYLNSTSQTVQTVQSLTSAIEIINTAIPLCRTNNLPIICVQYINKKEKLIEGVDGFELPDELKILSSDVHIQKTYGNSFNKANLYHQLKEFGVDTVLITGYCAEYCVLATYRGAKDLDLTPIILRGGIASGKVQNISFVEEICEIISIGALEHMLGMID